MTNLVIGLLTAALATNQPAALSNLVKDSTGIAVPIVVTNDPTEIELEKIMTEDNQAHAEVDRWIRDNNAFKAKGGGSQNEVLNAKIMARLNVVKQSYTNFIAKYPTNDHALLAYGSFLDEMGDEEGSIEQYEKACKLNPKNPAAWNQAANYYGHRSPVTKAFEYYAKAIELDPTESMYYQNFATVVYLFRKDAMEFYKITEQQVFDKAMNLYKEAERIEPENFELAQDVAQTYYGIRPPRFKEAMEAWTNAMRLATTDIEREGVHIHFARLNLAQDQYAEAHRHLDMVTNPTYNELKNRLIRNLQEREHPTGTNTTPAATGGSVITINPSPEPVKPAKTP